MNKRAARVLEHIRSNMVGVEIGPYHAPLCPKRDGWMVRVLDVVDTATLRRVAAADRNIPKGADIERVDIVCSAQDIALHVPWGSLDFVVSSHNFEHLPNPLGFLRAVEKVLKPGGVLSMVVPDYRRCFDTFRSPTTLGDMLEAFVEKRTKPTLKQIFDTRTLTAAVSGIVSPDARPETLPLADNLTEAWSEWLHKSTDYVDVHCSFLTPPRTEAILRDAKALGIFTLDILAVTPTHTHEFIVHLAKPLREGAAARREDHHATRTRLMQAAWSGG